MDRTVLVVGSINMDLVVRTPRIPKPGENVFGQDFRMIPGGKGANQAVGVARLGSRTLMSGRAGSDSFGDALMASLGNAGVDTSHVERDDETPTGIALITIDEMGENSIVIASGANAGFSSESVGRLAEAMSSADLVLLQLELPLDPVAEIINIARRLGTPVVLDAGPPCARPRSEFFDVTVLTPNEAEAEALSGRSITDRASAREVARHLLAEGPEAVVLKLGEDGAFLATRDREEFFPAYSVDVVDTTAAGDAFSAALSVALVDGKRLEDAVPFANAAGALAVTKLGAQPSLPTRRELEEFLSRCSIEGEDVADG
jgi:ribokinase